MNITKKNTFGSLLFKSTGLPHQTKFYFLLSKNLNRPLSFIFNSDYGILGADLFSSYSGGLIQTSCIMSERHLVSKSSPLRFNRCNQIYSNYLNLNCFNDIELVWHWIIDESKPISEQKINLVTLNWLILTDLIDWYCSVGIVLFLQSFLITFVIKEVPISKTYFKNKFHMFRKNRIIG